MQYILSKEEYENLMPIESFERYETALEAARRIIINQSEYPCGETYCDKCPLVWNPRIEDWRSSEIYNLICTKNKSFSK